MKATRPCSVASIGSAICIAWCDAGAAVACGRQGWLMVSLRHYAATQRLVATEAPWLIRWDLHMLAYLSWLDLTFMSKAVSWKLPWTLDFLNFLTSSSLRRRPIWSSSSLRLILTFAFSSLLALSRGLKRACMRMRKVVLKSMCSASPRGSGAFPDDSSMVRNLSRAVCRENAEGLSGTATTTKVSSGEMAVAVALRTPNLSQLRYLHHVSRVFCMSSEAPCLP